jgi:hypothetical protein
MDVEKHGWWWWLSGKAKDLEDVEIMKTRQQTDQGAKRLERVRREEAAQPSNRVKV